MGKGTQMQQQRRAATDRQVQARELLSLAVECEAEIDPNKPAEWSDDHVHSLRRLLDRRSMLKSADGDWLARPAQTRQPKIAAARMACRKRTSILPVPATQNVPADALVATRNVTGQTDWVEEALMLI